MNLKSIKTEKDYAFALERLEDIFDAKLGTPEGKELEVLGKMIEEYENEHYATPSLTPEQIEMLKMAEEDIKAGRVLSEEEMKAGNPEWLKE